MNGHASATCATNGKVVVAFFGRGGLHAYSLDGKPLWSRDLGRSKAPGARPPARSSMATRSFRTATANRPSRRCWRSTASTGETVWSTPREVIRGWSTPIVIKRAPARRAGPQRPHRRARLRSANGPPSCGSAKASTAAASRCRPMPTGCCTWSTGWPATFTRCGPAAIGRRHGDASRLAHAAQGRPRSAVAGRDWRLPAGDAAWPGMLFCYDCQSGKELWKERIGTEVFLHAAGGRRPGLLPERRGRHDRRRAGRRRSRSSAKSKLDQRKRRTVPLGDRPLPGPAVHPLEEVFVLHRQSEVSGRGRLRCGRPRTTDARSGVDDSCSSWCRRAVVVI